MNSSSIRSAYERGRWRDAARDAIPLMALFTLVLVAADAGVVQALLAGTVGVGFLVMRWRGLGWGRGAILGAIAGLAPLLAPFALVANGLGCAGPNCASWCVALCASGGLVAGLVVGMSSRSWSALVGGGLVAGLAGAVGCWPMGATTVVGMGGALVVGEVVAATFRLPGGWRVR
ncbi:MAG: hypothetical protein Q8P41_25620 [Pseudomonadota bacterium]|nr:hypothetical protein [Pseudomonadota bacterium]